MTPGRLFHFAAAAAVAFAVWGSLFPFVLDPVPPSALLSAFLAGWGHGPASWSISDFVSNVLLFVPIGLFGTAALQRSGARLRTAALATFGAASVLSVALELSQAVIRWRTSSIVDVLAEQIGVSLGIGAWILAGARLGEFAAEACAAFARASQLQRALMTYALVFAVVWLLPLDVTLRPGEIADKYFHKRLLLPFVPSPDALSRGELALAWLAAVPLGAAAGLSAAHRGVRDAIVRALTVAVPGLVLLELLQVFVFSRTTDSTVLLPLSGGVLAGAVLASR